MADKPVTREEKYLAYLTGDYTGEIPKPITRKEKYLYELCLKGMGGEISPEEIKNAVNEYLEKNGMKANAKETWENIMTIVENKVAAIRDAIVNKFTSARNRVVEIFGGIRDTIRNILNKVIGIVNRAIGTVNSAIGGIESAFSFGPWEVPTPFGKKTIGFHILILCRMQDSRL